MKRVLNQSVPLSKAQVSRLGFRSYRSQQRTPSSNRFGRGYQPSSERIRTDIDQFWDVNREQQRYRPSKVSDRMLHSFFLDYRYTSDSIFERSLRRQYFARGCQLSEKQRECINDRIQDSMENGPPRIGTHVMCDPVIIKLLSLNDQDWMELREKHSFDAEGGSSEWIDGTETLMKSFKDSLIQNNSLSRKQFQIAAKVIYKYFIPKDDWKVNEEADQTGDSIVEEAETGVDEPKLELLK